MTSLTVKDNWGWRLTSIKIIGEYVLLTKTDFKDHVY